VHNDHATRLRQDAHVLFAEAVTEDLRMDSLVQAPEPQEADLLMTALPADTPSLELGIQQFLSQLNDIGEELSRAMTRPGWLPWAVGASVMGMAALEFARRQQQRRRHADRVADRRALSWVPGLPGSRGFGDA
jgi:hypothetical protein